MNKATPPIFLFTYGTLMRGYHNHHRLHGSPFLGRAVTAAAYGLYDCGAYPGMAKEKGKGSFIKGEVYQISEDTLADCDVLEGHPHYYKREEIEVRVGDAGASAKAWAYFITYPNYLHWQPIGDQWPAEVDRKRS